MVNPTRPRSFSVNEMAADLNEVNKVVPDVVVVILEEIRSLSNHDDYRDDDDRK